MTYNDEHLTPFSSEFGDGDLEDDGEETKTTEPGEEGDGDDSIKPPAPGTDDDEEGGVGTEEY